MAPENRHTADYGTLVAVAAVCALLFCTDGCIRPEENRTPHELILQGWSDYRTGEYNLAVEAFQAAVDSATKGSQDYLQGLFGIAVTWDMRRQGQDRNLAKTVYEQILDEAPESDWAAWSLLALARQKHLAPTTEILDYPAIRDGYQRVIERYPYHLAGEEAFLFQQGTLIASLEPDDARKAVEATKQFIETHPDSPYLYVVYGLLSAGYGTLGMHREKLETAVKSFEMKELDPTAFADLQGDYWNIAVTAEFDAGDFDTARKFYQRFVDECPRDMKHYGAILALKRMDEVEAKARAELLAERSGKQPAEGSP